MATPDAELKVRIEAELAGFANSLKKGASDTKAFAVTVDNVLKRTEDQIKRTGNALGQSGNAVNKSTRDWTGLNRVIQDAPFGFIGIQNNLAQLIPNIGLFSIGLNLAISALTFAQVGTSAWTRGLVDNKKAVDNINKSGADYIETLGNISKARLKGMQGASEETTTLRLLYNQYTDTNRSIEERKSAYAQLQSLYPAYFENLKFETEVTDKTRDAYNSLTKSIIATAKARAFSDQIAQNAIKRQENEVKLLQLNLTAQGFVATAVERTDKSAKSLNATYSDQQKNFRLSNEQIAKNNQLAAEQAQKSTVYSNIQKSISSITRENNMLKSQDLKLEQEINKETANGATLVGNIGKEAKKSGESLSDLIKQLKEAKDNAYVNRLDATAGILRQQDDVIKKIGKSQKYETEKALKDGYKNALVELPKIATASDFVPENLGKDLYTPFEIFKENLEYDFLPKLGTGFETFFNDILEKGTFSFGALGQAILKTFTSVLANEATQGLLGLLGGKTANGQKMGGGGLLAGIVGLIGAKGGATTTAAAGTAATGGLLLPILGGLAAGGLIASLFKKKQPDPAPAFNSYSNNASSVTSDTFGSGTVVFQISGTNLVGVLNRAGAKLSRFGP